MVIIASHRCPDSLVRLLGYIEVSDVPQIISAIYEEAKLHLQQPRHLRIAFCLAKFFSIKYVRIIILLN